MSSSPSQRCDSLLLDDSPKSAPREEAGYYFLYLVQASSQCDPETDEDLGPSGKALRCSGLRGARRVVHRDLRMKRPVPFVFRLILLAPRTA